MKLIHIDTPNTSCMHQAFLEMIKGRPVESFAEVGPGVGYLSKLLCSRGASGIGIDFSQDSIAQLSANMADHSSRGQYTIIEADFMEHDFDLQADLVFSMLVMEHVEDDGLFLQKMKRLSKKDGLVLVAVPGRKDRWGIDDEIYGHHRRYDRNDLLSMLEKNGLVDIQVWSVAVPVSNALFVLTNMISRKSQVVERKNLPLSERTKISGLKDIPYKKTFPPWFKLILNEYTYFPFYVLQRVFYETNWGLTMIACGTNQ